MVDDMLDISQAQKERLSHIDFRVCFLGTIGRNDLVNRFGIKAAAATRDITLYKELAPRNLEYDTKAKVYTRSKDFEPLFDYSPNQALAALAHGFGDDFVGTHKGFIACETPAQLNKPSLSTLSVLTRAIHQEKVARITYRSLSSGRSTREIVPFMLVDNRLRWHVRAYDRRQSRFSDFVITRIADPVIIDSIVEEYETLESDNQWNRIVELEIVPHPRLKHAKNNRNRLCHGKWCIECRCTCRCCRLRTSSVECGLHRRPQHGRPRISSVA